MAYIYGGTKDLPARAVLRHDCRPFSVEKGFANKVGSSPRCGSVWGVPAACGFPRGIHTLQRTNILTLVAYMHTKVLYIFKDITQHPRKKTPLFPPETNFLVKEKNAIKKKKKSHIHFLKKFQNVGFNFCNRFWAASTDFWSYGRV